MLMLHCGRYGSSGIIDVWVYNEVTELLLFCWGSHNFEKHMEWGVLEFPIQSSFMVLPRLKVLNICGENCKNEVNKDIFDGSKEEEYEDGHGNVLTRATYEDSFALRPFLIVAQGLLWLTYSVFLKAIRSTMNHSLYYVWQQYTRLGMCMYSFLWRLYKISVTWLVCVSVNKETKQIPSS